MRACSSQEDAMKKGRKKPTPAVTKAAKVEPKSNASVYGAMLAKQVATEMTPARAVRNSKAGR
jgi:hypothetical protein